MAVYLVSQAGAPEGTKPRMVEARTKVSAISHVARSQFEAKPLSTKEALSWAGQGVDLEEAGADSE